MIGVRVLGCVAGPILSLSVDLARFTLYGQCVEAVLPTQAPGLGGDKVMMAVLARTRDAVLSPGIVL